MDNNYNNDQPNGFDSPPNLTPDPETQQNSFDSQPSVTPSPETHQNDTAGQPNAAPDFNQAPMGDPYNGNAPYNAPFNGSAPTSAGGPKGKAIASMVLGIVAVVLGCCILTRWIGIICAIIGLALGGVAIKKNEDGRGMAIAGLVCSIIAIAWFLLGLILLAAGSAPLGLAAFS